jgi:hypothetical protein
MEKGSINKWLPTKRCFDDYGPIRERKNKGKLTNILPIDTSTEKIVKGQEYRYRFGHFAETEYSDCLKMPSREPVK